MAQCRHVVHAQDKFSSHQLRYLYPVSALGGSCDVICMQLDTSNPPRNVAVKCFRERQHQDREEVKKKIEDELKIWNLINKNPNVVLFLGIIEAHDRVHERYIPPWAVSEYHENSTIDRYLSDQNADTQKRFQLLIGVIRGLVHIHSMKIVHGDLKASNIVVSDSGDEAKICDFGSSRICCDCYEDPKNQDGTAQWDSPELWTGGLRTPSSDVWAFGCVALETQFSLYPYDRDIMKTHRMQKRGYPPATESPASPDAPSISRRIWHVMLHCWNPDPDARPDAQTLRNELVSGKGKIPFKPCCQLYPFSRM